MIAEIPVLIVGGGPIGLTAAVGLRNLGVDCMLVERHRGTLGFPKGRRVTVRSVEIFRQWNLEAAVTDVSLPRSESLFVYRGETLFAREFERTPQSAETTPFSPTQELICSQDVLEPVLRERAQALGADVRFATAMTEFIQDEKGVTAQLASGDDRAPFTVRAQFLIAVDGARSNVRSALGISRSGAGVVGDRVSILVEADLAARMEGRQAVMSRLTQPRRGTGVAAVDNKRLWLLILPHRPESEPAESFTNERCAAIARQALGDDGIEVRIRGVQFWQAAALVADKFQAGRVFLAGDAAHITTPLGGLGMNCGLADVHNLAWKIAGVLAGCADPSLLNTYELERQPIARATADASLGAAQPPAPVQGLVLGYAYESPAIISDGISLPAIPERIGDYTPSARSGCRAPHVWMTANGSRKSTLDLFGKGFVALTGAGSHVSAAARSVARSVSIPLEHFVIEDTDFLGLYGIGPDGIVIVRPDGHVAWRAPALDERAENAIRAALAHAARPSKLAGEARDV
jgi:2-polyprenyl-6-methoxyphenol hydroxylase-like FAD-dependent oxidoreductase